MSDDKTEQVCCAECGSLNVQYAVWYSPRTGQTHEEFGSWNAGDNTFCEDCDMEGRDPNPNLLDKDVDEKEYTRLRAKREKYLAKTKKERVDALKDTKVSP